MDTPAIRAAGTPGWVEDHATRFTARGFTWLEPRFLALEPAPGERAHGLLAELPEARWRALSAHEHGYRAVELEVHTASGPHRASAWMLESAERVTARPPSARYAQRLVAGAQAGGLPDHVVERYRLAGSQGSRCTLHLRPVVAAARWLVGVLERR